MEMEGCLPAIRIRGRCSGSRALERWVVSVREGLEIMEGAEEMMELG